MNYREKFGVDKDATVDEVKAHWQKVAMEFHPDHDGDPVAFTLYKNYYDNALWEAQKAPKCKHCKDTKKMKVKQGFTTIELLCSWCK
jgi:curved DNA-binding protein CbpA